MISMKAGKILGALVLLAAAPACADSLEGNWKPVTAELGGKKLPDAVLAAMKLKIDAGHYTLTTAEGADRGDLTMDTTKKPMAMDIAGTEGPNKGRTILAVYRLAGDKLTICYDLGGGKARPAKLECDGGGQQFLVDYRRDKP